MKKMGSIVSLFAAIMVSGAATPAEGIRHESSVIPLTVERLIEMDQRLLTVGHRLLVSNAAHCKRRGWLPGIQLSTGSQFEPHIRPTVAKVLGLGSYPVVTALATESAARHSGLLVGDAVLAVDGVPMVADRLGMKATAEISEEAFGQLSRGFFDGRAEIDILRDGQRLKISVTADYGCNSRLFLKIAREISAGTDGQDIVVSSGMLEFASDNELAALAGHELAHIVLDDLVGRPRQGKRRSREDEADALGLVLAAQAGYDTDGMAKFWRRYGQRDKLGLFRSWSHSTPNQRAAAADALAARIQREGLANVRDELISQFLQRAGQTGTSTKS